MKSILQEEKVCKLLELGWKICENYKILVPPKNSKYENYCTIYELFEDLNIWVPHYIQTLRFWEDLENGNYEKKFETFE